MALPQANVDREYRKFRDGGAAGTRVATVFEGAFQVPADADAFTVSYPSPISEVYQFRSGGVSGTVLMTITLTYSDSTKSDLVSGVRS